ncbi:Folliculin-interacting protein 1 [Gryganskiella cystojenkinii]|nr:Folliculin-interacting protein 1 [Gryganskiella cystojenkinii]
MAKGNGSGSGHARSIPDLARLIFQHETRILEAVARFQQSLYELYSAPRIQSPLWLNIHTYPSKRATYSASFISELNHLMEDSPASSQLISEVISAVLRHHVSWVPTVAPPEESSTRVTAQGGYDPLWAQLSDLYGNIGTSSRISRTIVVGSNGNYVRRLLFVLSYFIRCNEVFQSVTEVKEDPDSLLNPPKPSRMHQGIHEDYESGSPATMVRSINIPKRPRIDTFVSSSTRGSSSVTRASVSSRLTAIGEPTTPILPHHNDRPITPSVSRRPLFDTTRPRVESRDSLSTESTPYHSRPTSPMTIDSRPDSDRASAQGDETGPGQQQPQPLASSSSQTHLSTTGGPAGGHLTAPQHNPRVDTMRSRTQSSDTLATENSHTNLKSAATGSDREPGLVPAPHEILANVPLPASRVLYTFPPVPSPASYTSLTHTASMAYPPPQPSLLSSTSTDPSSSLSKSVNGGGLGINTATAVNNNIPTTPATTPGPPLSAASFEKNMKSGPGGAVPNINTEDKILPADVLFCKSYGRSLMAPYCDHYMPDFALMGVPRFDFMDFMETDMKETMRHFEVQEKIQSTVCIVADANTMKCNVFCARASPACSLLASSAPSLSPRMISGSFGGGRLNGGAGTVGAMSGLHQYLSHHENETSGIGAGLGELMSKGEHVVRIPNVASSFLDVTLHQMLDLSRNGLAAEMCLNYLEDRLYQLYQYSRMLSSLTRDSEVLRMHPTLDAMSTLLGLQSSDMPLVLAVASTYDDLVVGVFE